MTSLVVAVCCRGNQSSYIRRQDCVQMTIAQRGKERRIISRRVDCSGSNSTAGFLAGRVANSHAAAVVVSSPGDRSGCDSAACCLMFILLSLLLRLVIEALDLLSRLWTCDAPIIVRKQRCIAPFCIKIDRCELRGPIHSDRTAHGPITDAKPVIFPPLVCIDYFL